MDPVQNFLDFIFIFFFLQQEILMPLVDRAVILWHQWEAVTRDTLRRSSPFLRTTVAAGQTEVVYLDVPACDRAAALNLSQLVHPPCL